MGFRINTNVSALSSHVNAVGTNRMLSSSLGRLSSGLRIQTAADDASGLAIADSLRSQASSLGQAVANGNDAIGIIQTADKAMDEQLKILDTIKTKAVQAAQDGQTFKSRRALQADINRLMEELDNIGNTTSFNGQQLLSGTFTNKEFQIGAYSNEVVKASIGATTSDKIGLTRFETGENITKATSVALTFVKVDGINDVKLEGVRISHSAGTGLGVLAEVINKNSEKIGVRASYVVQENGKTEVKSGTIKGLKINDVVIANTIDVQKGDHNNALVNAINDVKDTTGVVASINKGKLVLTSLDGRGMKIEATSGLQNVGGLGNDTKVEQYGRLSLVRLGGRDIVMSSAGAELVGHKEDKVAQKTVSLRETKGQISKDVASAMGFNANLNVENISSSKTAGVTTLRGAMAVMNIAETAINTLDAIRSDLGSVQNQLVATVNNISVTQVNVKAAESQIRDVDFAKESANFAKFNILAQSGSYALSQSNAVQQNVLRLLQ